MRAGAFVGWEGCEVRLCDPRARVSPLSPLCPRVSRQSPRCLLTARGSWRGRASACALAVRVAGCKVGLRLVVRFEIRRVFRFSVCLSRLPRVFFTGS